LNSNSPPPKPTNEDSRRSGLVALQVLPHPGGGGETYVDLLEGMSSYAFERRYLARGSRPIEAAPSLVGSAVSANLAARRADVLHAHGEVAGTLCLPALARRPSVVTLHGTHLLRRLSGPARRVAAANLRLMVAASSRTICVSPVERELVLDVLGMRDPRRVVVIQNGVGAQAAVTGAERAAARNTLGLETEDVVAIWLGGLDEHKDPLTAIHAAERAAHTDSRLKLVIVGDGPLREEVERAVHDSETGAVRFMGRRSDVRAVLAAADFLVLSSRREGLSFALLEAMSFGLTPVVADAPENVAAIGEAGIVVAAGNVEAFGEALLQLTADELERTRLGELARRRVEREFRADEMQRRTQALYDEVRQERGSRRSRSLRRLRGL
jgi:glycosyltransferase involved in cell wall biosynthesis